MRRDGLVTRRPSRRIGASNFVPTDLNGLVLWLRADLGITTDIGGTVAAWDDQSGAGHDFAEGNTAIQPNLVASETDFPTPQPSVKFDIASNQLVGPGLASIAWYGVVAISPGATFGNLNSPLTVTGAGGIYVWRGATGTGNWRTADSPVGNRFTDGVDTDVAMTAANQPHFYEMVPNAAHTGTATYLGTNSDATTRIWGDSIAEVFAATVAPDAAALTALRAYLKTRYGFAA
ncbi:MAG TPA: hypothetical protein VGK73_13680 [Polyangiaceae bacterium]